jgi:hypothetical protein
VEYQAVGFGSHHWLATDTRGAWLFVTVDDLSAKRRTVSDAADAVFDRLTRAFSAAMSLRADAGLAFVVAAVSAAGGLVIIDWDTALLAPPGRDLWDLARHDESLLHTYAAATGVDIDQDALWLYRLWYDLAEIGGYLSLFRATHRQTADTAESWKNLRHFLQPAERWPALYEPGAGRARATT